VLILREVLGFSAREGRRVARHDRRLGEQRAAVGEKTVDERLPDESQQARCGRSGTTSCARSWRLHGRDAGAATSNAVVEILAEDAAWSMPPLAAWFRGREALIGFLVRGPLSGDWRWRRAAARANGVGGGGQLLLVCAGGDLSAVRGRRADPRRPPDQEITSFITRSTDGADPRYYERWPEQPVDAAGVMGFFERFGSPGQLD
jgi:RNA polymerase sigma-70 factor, ECF subfamily